VAAASDQVRTTAWQRQPWEDNFTDADRVEIREQGRRLLGLFLAEVDAPPSTRAEAELAHRTAAAAYGALFARLGVPLAGLVVGHAQFQGLLMAEIAEIATARNLSAEQSRQALLSAAQVAAHTITSVVEGFSAATAAPGPQTR
jgi:hypothetical protein